MTCVRGNDDPRSDAHHCVTDGPHVTEREPLPKTKDKIQMMRRVRIALVATSLFLSLGVIPASAAEGGSPGPCVAGTPLEGVRLGWDVGFVARDGGTPLPSNFAFEGGDPMPPGRLMGYAREAGLC